MHTKRLNWILHLLFSVCPAIGVADQTIVPDNQFNASSSYDEDYAPYNARLNGNLYGWTPKWSDLKTAYLQIDFGAVYFICAVATQGSKFNNEWIKTYKLQLSMNGSSWTFYQEDGKDKVSEIEIMWAAFNCLDKKGNIYHIK